MYQTDWKTWNACNLYFLSRFTQSYCRARFFPEKEPYSHLQNQQKRIYVCSIKRALHGKQLKLHPMIMRHQTIINNDLICCMAKHDTPTHEIPSNGTPPALLQASQNHPAALLQASQIPSNGTPPAILQGSVATKTPLIPRWYHHQYVSVDRWYRCVFFALFIILVLHAAARDCTRLRALRRQEQKDRLTNRLTNKARLRGAWFQNCASVCE